MNHEYAFGLSASLPELDARREGRRPVLRAREEIDARRVGGGKSRVPSGVTCVSAAEPRQYSFDEFV